ncbi:hypothetical protein ADEAN_000304500 [Angomonas deanei]|uniref:Uncharacterized protein n=1 Tax=Angomonas deanei TaxID=59799 RepID=A0A7G2C701_9TRYP|nr:hypothetical protein ADEAN_000304500 [Angomonas deanei]
MMLSTFMKANQNTNNANNSMFDPNAEHVLDMLNNSIFNNTTHHDDNEKLNGKKPVYHHGRSHTLDSIFSPVSPHLAGENDTSGSTPPVSARAYNNKSLMLSTVLDDTLSQAIHTNHGMGFNTSGTTPYNAYPHHNNPSYTSHNNPGHLGNLLVEYTVRRKKLMTREAMEWDRLQAQFMSQQRHLRLVRLEKEEETARRSDIDGGDRLVPAGGEEGVGGAAGAAEEVFSVLIFLFFVYYECLNGRCSF